MLEKVRVSILHAACMSLGQLLKIRNKNPIFYKTLRTQAQNLAYARLNPVLYKLQSYTGQVMSLLQFTFFVLFFVMSKMSLHLSVFVK